MTLEELRLQCSDAIANCFGMIALVLPGIKTSRSRRLFGKCGPLGEVVCDNYDGNSVCCFDAAAVLDYIDKVRDKGQA